MPGLKRLVAALDTRDHVRGRQWERICRWYLLNDPVYKSQISRVWLWKTWPGRWGPDAGIDLVAQLRDGLLMAVQAKAVGELYSVTKADVDSFLSESARPEFSRRLLIATTNHVGHTAMRTLQAQATPSKFLSLGDLERAQVEWPACPEDLRAKRLPPKRPRPHQRDAVEAVRSGFRDHDRGKLVMACGTGKTLVGLWVAEDLMSLRTLLLFPSLTLLAQTLREWAANAKMPFEALAVCSDATVYDPDAFVEHTNDLDIRVTTNPIDIRAFLRGEGPRVVFATYQSSPELASAMKSGDVPPFDLAIADEAHRCVGRLVGAFATILDPNAIRAKRRLFMTATPRYFTGRIKGQAASADYELASMDDPEHFGPSFYQLSFGEAIRRRLLSDYQVAIVGIDNATYRGYAQRGVFVTTDGKKVTDARTLAGQIGLARAMRKYKLRRTISFHSRIAWARAFSASVPEVIAWMPAPARPPGNVWCRLISGEMPSGERDSLLGRFRELEPGERGLLSNARCLSEGVDVPTLDGVAFIDPRRSQIDIVQAVGRAIRTSAGKKLGTVLLPVFIDNRRRPETALDSSAFKPVWDVLKALRAHDPELGEHLDALRRALGERSTGALRLPAKIRFDLPTSVDHRFVHSLKVRLVEQTTETWEFWFGMLEKFVQRHGTAAVMRGQRPAGFALDSWVHVQRRAHATGKLSGQRALRLSALPGWVWNAREVAWETGFAALQAFAHRHGTAAVRRDQRPDGFPLGAWAQSQRTAHTAGKLSRQRELRLVALPGWVWDKYDSAWENGLASLKRFVKRTGHTRMPKSYVDGNFSLGSWVAHQRNKHVVGRLSDERVGRLSSFAGWSWDPFEEDWDVTYALLKRFAAREGHALPPARHREQGVALGRWLSRQRRLARKGELSEDRRRLLDALPGWQWDPRHASWEGSFDTLKAFAARDGHAQVPQGTVENGIALGSWVNGQRMAEREGRLTTDRRSRLERLPGWSWDVADSRWSDGYRALLRFVAGHQHARVPQNHGEDGFPLGHWVNLQRQLLKRGSLSKEREARLGRVKAWARNPHEARWEKAFLNLRAFAAREGHARVPKAHMERSFRLGQWVRTQRGSKKKGTLTPERQRRLSASPGWTWKARASGSTPRSGGKKISRGQPSSRV